jgi:hypothetical protein
MWNLQNDMSKKHQYIIASLISSGGALLTIVQVRGNVDALVKIPEWVYSLLLILGILLLATSLFIYLLLKLIERKSWETIYYTRIVEKKDFQLVIDFCKSILDEDHIPSLEKMSFWYSLNPNMFYMIVEEKRKSNSRYIRIKGFFSVLPTTQEAHRLLSKNLLKGGEFNERHIARKSQKPSSLYLGAVIAEGIKGKELTLMAVMGCLTSYSERVTPHVFTHPVTKDGLRIALKYKFAPVVSNWSKPSEQIYYRNLSERG